MFGLTKLMNAVASLSDALTSLASTVNEMNANARARLSLDAPQDTPALEAPTEGNGTGRRKRSASA
jgi:hypothetical protein